MLMFNYNRSRGAIEKVYEKPVTLRVPHRVTNGETPGIILPFPGL
jgi:hypothetical protein